jgi:hypothetical protein
MAAWLSGAAARTAWMGLDLAGSSRPTEAAGRVPAPVQQPHAQGGHGDDGQADQARDDPAARPVVGRRGGRLGRGRAVADGAGAGVVVAVGAARTSRIAETPMFPPPQRPLRS